MKNTLIRNKLEEKFLSNDFNLFKIKHNDSDDSDNFSDNMYCSDNFINESFSKENLSSSDLHFHYPDL